MDKINSRRLNFNVTDNLSDRVKKWPHGLRGEVMRTLLTYAADMYDRHGELALGAILAGKFHLESDAISKRPN